MNFNDRLIELRKSKGWSQEELGGKLNVTRQTVSKWELGQTTPEMDKLIDISEVFDISIDTLVGKEDINKKEVFNRREHFHYEYKSKKELFGLPLVHINVGIGIRKAKGILAIGTIAKGIIAIGALSTGIIALGALSIGILAFGALAAALLAAGGIAFGGIAVGGFALGFFAVGGLAIGIYSVGGCAIASNIAMGGYANAHIAIGDSASGDMVWNHISELTQGDYSNIRETILHEYPHIWKWILNIFT